jgi:hypothetical protein
VRTAPPSRDSYNTQFDFVLPVRGTRATSYLYAGDRYSNFHGSGVPAPTGEGRNAWHLLEFEGDIPVLRGCSRISVDAVTGLVAVEPVAHAEPIRDAPPSADAEPSADAQPSADAEPVVHGDLS